MDPTTLNTWRTLVKKLLTDLAAIPYPDGIQLAKKTVFDDQANIYLVLVHGWEDVRRLHGCLVHIEIINDKIWIQQDGTEYGIATDLLAAGVPKEKIVLGFKTPRSRQHTEFAVA